MLALLGTLSVLTAFLAALLLIVRGWVAASSDEQARSVDLRTPSLALLVGAGAAMAVLEVALLVDDFTIAYLADNHSSTTPFPFNIATAWAALEGSIVLWGLVLAAFTYAVYRSHARSRDRLGAGALAVMGAVALFFFGLMLTVSNPFETCVTAAERSCAETSWIPLVGAEAPLDGRGPNALLQNHILMAVHPPMLYLGYVGLTVPFAFAMSALAIRRPGSEWLARSKRWTLVAWSFLTLGIVLGGWWAYEVLSWGGYWTWDPVENASFMPWLAATAFLHSALVQQRRGMLQAWNFVLVIAAFALTILGTFLTRSGTIASVHSFTQSAIGPTLLGFLVLVMAGSFGLFAIRANDVVQPSRLDSLSSREGAFVFNNLLLTVYAFIVLVGTVYPLILEAINDEVVRVGPPFFNRLAVPLSFVLLLAMGVGPVMPWRVAKPELIWRRIHGPIQVALGVGALTVLFTSRVGWVVLALVLGTFLLAVIVRHLFVQARDAAAKKSTSVLAETRRIIGRDPSYWGGQLSHAGVALLTIGIAFAANLSVHNEATLVPGETVSFDGYELTYQAPFTQTEPNRRVLGVTIDVSRDGEYVTELRPLQNEFSNAGFGIATPAVFTTLGGDLYLTLLSVDVETREIELQLDSSPMMWLVWLGGLTTAAGGFVSMRARAIRRRQEPVHA